MLLLHVSLSRPREKQKNVSDSIFRTNSFQISYQSTGQNLRERARIEFCIVDGFQRSRNVDQHRTSMDLASVSLCWIHWVQMLPTNT